MLLILPSGVMIDWQDASSIFMDITGEFPRYYFHTGHEKVAISKKDFAYLSRFKEAPPSDEGRLRDKNG